MTDTSYTSLVAAAVASAVKEHLDWSRGSWTVTLEGGTGHGDPMVAVVTHPSVPNRRWRVTTTEEEC